LIACAKQEEFEKLISCCRRHVI